MQSFLLFFVGIKYVFGSDEYLEYVGSDYNDVFGFFLDGVNVALIPGTNTPVSINNVNNDVNSEYFNDNDLSNGTPTPFAFEYDGFTDGFVASMEGLTAGTHHLKLAIADAGDEFIDAGVFVEAGSFSDVDPTVPEPASMLLFGLGTIGLIVIKKIKK